MGYEEHENEDKDQNIMEKQILSYSRATNYSTHSEVGFIKLAT
jgi:hypothetical protein